MITDEEIEILKDQQIEQDPIRFLQKLIQIYQPEGNLAIGGRYSGTTHTLFYFNLINNKNTAFQFYLGCTYKEPKHRIPPRGIPLNKTSDLPEKIAKEEFKVEDLYSLDDPETFSYEFQISLHESHESNTYRVHLETMPDQTIREAGITQEDSHFKEITEELTQLRSEGDFRPIMQRMLEIYAGHEASNIGYENNILDYEAGLEQAINMFFDEQDRKNITRKLKNAIGSEKYPSIPRLNLGMIEIPTGNIEEVTKTGAYLIETLSQLGIMTEGEAQDIIETRIVNYFMKDFETSYEKAKRILG